MRIQMQCSMDSDSYLVKIIRSGTEHTEDSLYLQTTIGKDIRWPIVLLISTSVTIVAVFTCLVWAMVRRPTAAVKPEKRNSNDGLQGVMSTSTPIQSSKPPPWPLNSAELDYIACKEPLWATQAHGTSTEIDNGQTPDPTPKRKVSWANSDSIRHIPRTKRHRRHSEMTPSPLGAAVPSSSSSSSSSLKKMRRYSCLGLSPVARLSNHEINSPDIEGKDAATIKINKSSELHLQISKTIAVLDDLNKSLQESRENTHLLPSSETHKRVLKSLKTNKASVKTSKSDVTLNMESIKSDFENVSPGFVSNDKDIEELKRILDTQFDNFYGQNLCK